MWEQIPGYWRGLSAKTEGEFRIDLGRKESRRTSLTTVEPVCLGVLFSDAVFGHVYRVLQASLCRERFGLAMSSHIRLVKHHSLPFLPC